MAGRIPPIGQQKKRTNIVRLGMTADKTIDSGCRIPQAIDQALFFGRSQFGVGMHK